MIRSFMGTGPLTVSSDRGEWVGATASAMNSIDSQFESPIKRTPNANKVRFVLIADVLGKTHFQNTAEPPNTAIVNVNLISEEQDLMRTTRRQSRRNLLRSGLGVAACSPWLPRLSALADAPGSNAAKHCVILWMPGGPSQIDTFDMKPGHANGGEFKEIQTASPGLRFSEHLPKLAEWSERLAVLRGLSTKEGDHERATVLMQTGHRPGGPVAYPAMGCALTSALFNEDLELPGYMSVSGSGIPFASSRSPGFLGPKYAATLVGANVVPDDYAQLSLDFLSPGPAAGAGDVSERLELWKFLEQEAARRRPAENVLAHQTVYNRAIRMMQSDARQVFDLSEEPDKVRDAYGKGVFGQGCLLARRLIEHGVPLVEVSLGNGLGWDTHLNNFESVRELSEQLDAGWSSLMRELDERGLLESTTILWAGEFGRAPKINPNGGRDHFPQAWSCVLAGGGIQGGGVYGKTNDSGMEVVDGRINEQDVLATLCKSLAIDPSTENITPDGRPIKIAEGNPIESVLS